MCGRRNFINIEKDYKRVEKLTKTLSYTNKTKEENSQNKLIFFKNRFAKRECGCQSMSVSDSSQPKGLKFIYSL